jgi:hypothetical protein
MHRERSERGEEGATLILALVFVVAVAFVLLAIVSLTGTNLADTANLQNGRALEYTADGAVDAAIQGVRYCPVSNGTFSCAQAPVTPCSATSGLSVSTASGPVNGVNPSPVVYCEVATPQFERQVTFTACPAGESLTACRQTHSNGTKDEILVAQVLYSDVASGCFSGCGAVIGQSASVLTWNVERSNG